MATPGSVLQSRVQEVTDKHLERMGMRLKVIETAGRNLGSVLVMRSGYYRTTKGQKADIEGNKVDKSALASVGKGIGMWELCLRPALPTLPGMSGDQHHDN